MHEPITTATCGIPCADIVALRRADQRAHTNLFEARVADNNGAEARNERFLDGVNEARRNHGAADRGAFLTRLDRHLLGNFLDEKIEFGCAGR